MSDTLSDFAALLERCWGDIGVIFRRSTDRAQWAEGLAEWLGDCAPSAAWTACLLNGEGTARWAVRPGEKVDSSERKHILQSQLSSLYPLARGVETLPLEAMPGYRVLVSAIHYEERPRGFLIIALPRATPQVDVAHAEAILTAVAPTVAQCWTMETLQFERAEWERFTLLGRAFTGLAHELNNILNSMMLQTSMVQLRVDPQRRQELAAIRQQGAQAAELLRSCQHFVHQHHEALYPVDLESVLAEMLEENPDLRRRVSLRSSVHSPHLQSTRSAVKQFLRLLLEGVCAGTKDTVSAAIETQEHGVALTLTVASANFGIDGAPSALQVTLWQHLDEVSRQAGQALLRELGGILTAQRAGEDSTILRIVWE
jgi:signal transduction histidine kinase